MDRKLIADLDDCNLTFVIITYSARPPQISLSCTEVHIILLFLNSKADKTLLATMFLSGRYFLIKRNNYGSLGVMHIIVVLIDYGK